MNMKNKEIEIKLRLLDINQAKKIKQYFLELAEKDEKSFQKIDMRAVYYDTITGFLHDHRIAYRVRQENKNIVATYKSGTVNKEGVFSRIEINKNVKSLSPDISVFASEKSIWDVLKSVENSDFMPIVRTNFVRECIDINWHGSLIEAAVDLGEVYGKNNKLPICEVELELKNGEEAALLELKKSLEESFSLRTSSISKYHQGLILAGLA